MRARRGPKGRLAKGRLAKGRKRCGLRHNETYGTPIFCTVPLPKVPLVPSKERPARRNGGEAGRKRGRQPYTQPATPCATSTYSSFYIPRMPCIPLPPLPMNIYNPVHFIFGYLDSEAEDLGNEWIAHTASRPLVQPRMYWTSKLTRPPLETCTSNISDLVTIPSTSLTVYPPCESCRG